MSISKEPIVKALRDLGPASLSSLISHPHLPLPLRSSHTKLQFLRTLSTLCGFRPSHMLFSKPRNLFLPQPT